MKCINFLGSLQQIWQGISIINLNLDINASHIFQKAQVAANKNAHNFRDHFWTQFFMLFRENSVCSTDSALPQIMLVCSTPSLSLLYSKTK